MRQGVVLAASLSFGRASSEKTCCRLSEATGKEAGYANARKSSKEKRNKKRRNTVELIIQLYFKKR